MRTEQASEANRDFDGGTGREAAGGGEEERISLGDPRQVQEWASRLGVSPEHLRELVAQVGPRLRDLEQRLSQPGAID